MEGRPRIHHPLSVYLEMTKDKNGLIKTRLKIPYWSRQEPQPPVDLSDEDICIIGKKEINFKLKFVFCSSHFSFLVTFGDEVIKILCRELIKLLFF